MSLLVTFMSGIIGSLVAPRRRSLVLRGTGAILACVSVLAGSVVSVASAESAPTVVTSALDTSGQPVDVEGAGVHAAAVRELHGLGVLAGTECASGGFCWGDPVTREIAAVWIVRVLDGGDDEVDSVGSRFSDVDPGGEWAAHIERLAELGVTLGCAAEPARFCPHYTATRSQAASFLARAFELGSAEPAGFGDTAGSVHETNIDALYAAGITTGCLTDPLLFCPRDPTTRAQMASFLNRARTLDTGTDDSDETGSSSSGGGGSTVVVEPVVVEPVVVEPVVVEPVVVEPVVVEPVVVEPVVVEPVVVEPVVVEPVVVEPVVVEPVVVEPVVVEPVVVEPVVVEPVVVEPVVVEPVVVEPVVGPPRNVELLVGDGWLAVQWAPPEDGGDGIAEYLVQWKPAAAAGWDGAAEATVPAGRFMHTINGLANGVPHTVHVRAEPAVGEGAWSEEVTGSAGAAPPLELSLNGGLQERIVLTWQAPDSATTSSVAQYVVQWYRPRTPHDATRRMEVPATDTQVTIFDVEADVVWWVRVSAVDALGRVLGRSDLPTLTKLASDVIEQRVVEAFEEDFPWLRQTWNVPIPVNVGGRGAVYGFLTSANVRTVSGTNWPNLTEGLYYKFSASGQYTNNRVVMHEMAHHFTLDIRVPENPASVAVGWLYFDQLVSGHCSVVEIYADVLAYHTVSGKWSAWDFLAGCTQVGRPPKDEALAVVASISDGEIPQWLFDTYSTDETANTIDLDGLWSDVKALSGFGSVVAYSLHTVFGGYCSDKEAIAANRASAPVYKNPWVQGGCETRWPRDLTAAASGSGAISVSWTAPYYATTPTIDAYVVQWKGDGEQYDSSRQALVTDLASLSYTITGLISGEQYSVRVAAVNQADTADFVDDDSRTRAAETAAVAG